VPGVAEEQDVRVRVRRRVGRSWFIGFKVFVGLD